MLRQKVIRPLYLIIIVSFRISSSEKEIEARKKAKTMLYMSAEAKNIHREFGGETTYMYIFSGNNKLDQLNLLQAKKQYYHECS